MTATVVKHLLGYFVVFLRLGFLIFKKILKSGSEITGKSQILNKQLDLCVLDTTISTTVFCAASTWVLTKEQNIDEATLKIIKAAMKKIAEDGGPSFADVKQNDQSNCS